MFLEGWLCLKTGLLLHHPSYLQAFWNPDYALSKIE